MLHLSPVPSTTIDCAQIGRNAKRGQLKPRAMLFIALFKRSAIFLVQSDPDYAEWTVESARPVVWEGLLVVTTKHEIRVKPPWKWLCMEYASYGAASSSVNKEAKRFLYNAAGSSRYTRDIANNKCTSAPGLEVDWKYDKFMRKLLFFTT